jgi:CBS domain containing-hemolysin-like protein
MLLLFVVDKDLEGDDAMLITLIKNVCLFSGMLAPAGMGVAWVNVSGIGNEFFVLFTVFALIMNFLCFCLHVVKEEKISKRISLGLFLSVVALVVLIRLGLSGTLFGSVNRIEYVTDNYDATDYNLENS